MSCLLPGLVAACASEHSLLLLSEPAVLLCDLLGQKGDVLWMDKSPKLGAGR